MRQRKLKAASASASASEAAVLGNDDLLREILVRLDHPTCLVHAALVSRRWLRHASDPAFLRRFRGLHPPHLLGLYVRGCGEPSRFVPLPHPRELDVVFRRASFHLGDGVVLGCRNGRALMFRLDLDSGAYEFNVCSPLHRTPHVRLGSPLIGHSFLPEDGGDGTCYTTVKLMCSGTEIAALHCVVRAAGVSEVRTSATIEAPSQWHRHMDSALLVNSKCYILGDAAYILGLDVPSMTLRVINLPDGVQPVANRQNMALSGANGLGFHLIYLKGFEILVWHHDDTDDAGGWQLVDTICIRQAIAHLAQSDWEFSLKYGSTFVKLHGVPERAEFLLNLGHEFFHMHIGSRKVEKVFEMPPDDDGGLYRNSVIHPIMMVWPPSFPALSDEQVHQGQDD